MDKKQPIQLPTVKNPSDPSDGPTYLTWSNSSELKEILSDLDLEQEFGLAKASHSSYRNTRDILPGLSGRPGLTRNDYDYFRPSETVPTKIKDVIARADVIYSTNGLVRNIIDLMGDFACQGVRLSHTDERIQVFYKAWFEKVAGKDRSERFLNNLYRTANVVIRRQEAKISLKQRSAFFKSLGAKDDIDIQIEPKKFNKDIIPAKYTFLNPVLVDIVGGELASFTNDKQYVLTIPSRINSLFDDKTQKRIELKDVPRDIRKALKTNKPFPLPKDKTLVFHYKKDDWQSWAEPMVKAIMEDILMLDKLKLCDMAALDGATSHVRIFKLGNLEHKIIPAAGAVSKLKNIITSHVGGGAIDIVWGPDIELLESSVDINQFLGPEKYTPVLNNIYGGLGIPPTLTGAFSAGGTTNNFVSLKTLIQRLQYGRDVLLSFWQEEIIMVQKAMGFAEPAILEFDYPDLGDSDSEKALLIQMADRNLISDELLQERFSNNPIMEKSRIAKEDKARKAQKRPKKGGPYFEAITQPGQEDPNAKKTGQPQQGRPKTVKDKTKRKTKTFRPKTKASLQLWALDAQHVISEIVNPVLLKSLKKKNMRSLSISEHRIAENIKFDVLFNLFPFVSLSKTNILEAFHNKKDNINPRTEYQDNKGIIATELNRVLTVDELKIIQATIYTEQFKEEPYDN